MPTIVGPSTVGPSFFPPGNYKSANYYFCNSATSVSTSATLGNGTGRVTAWVVHGNLTIVRLFADFSVAGEANSVFRIGIWADDGTAQPGALVLDAGSISTGSGNAGTVATGGTPGVYEITVSQALAPGVYWVGGAVQGAPSTQPTIRIGGASVPSFQTAGTALPAAGTLVTGYQQTGMSGAFGAFTAPVVVGAAARIGFKVA